MSDWLNIDVPSFDALVLAHEPKDLASLGVLDRLPFAFSSKLEYLRWRDMLADGLRVDGKDVALVGSAATGRSLSARKKFGVFKRESDLDVSVVSTHHFEIAWRWFRTTNPNMVTGLDAEMRKKFDAHRSHYVFEGVIAADYFLSFLPFGNDWVTAMQRSEELLPQSLRGRLMKIRLYREYSALRTAQIEAISSYRRVLENKIDNQNRAESE